MSRGSLLILMELGVVNISVKVCPRLNENVVNLSELKFVNLEIYEEIGAPERNAKELLYIPLHSYILLYLETESGGYKKLETAPLCSFIRNENKNNTRSHAYHMASARWM